MDSVTQLLLGAAVGGAVMGRRAGAPAFVWGGAVGTMPDLDVVMDLGNAVANFTYHRGFSHALLFVSLAAVPLAAAADRLHEDHHGRCPGRWLLALWLVLITHVLLDALTIYGTQLLQPFSGYPVGLGSIFIIDPLYTLPLIGGLVMTGLCRASPRAGYWNLAGLLLSTAYLGWTVVAQAHVEDLGRRALAAQAVDYERMLATPTPFNSVLWRVLAVSDDAYYEGYHRLGGDRPLRFHRQASRPQLLDGLRQSWAVQRLRYFTKGFYVVSADRGRIVITDLRMGQTPYFAFRFQVGKRAGGDVRPVASRELPGPSRPPLTTIVNELTACAGGRPTVYIVC